MVKPVIHARDHERGGADTIRLIWEDLTDVYPTTGWADAPLAATWTNFGTAINTGPGTFTNGTTPGWWEATTGANWFCGLTGTWRIEITGTVTHTGDTVPVYLALLTGGTTITVLLSATMATGTSNPISYSGETYFADGDSVLLAASHGGTSGTASSTLTGTSTYTNTGP